MANKKLLSIAIPAYNRPKELLYCLKQFIDRIEGKYNEEIEIIVSDDCSPNDSLEEVRRLADSHSFLTYVRYGENIGLEKNLLGSTARCSGEYLWIFGDDDFLEGENALDVVIEILNARKPEFLVLNRTRRSFSLDKVLSNNWMGIPPGEVREYPGLRDFCLEFGLISVIGFISVNIFKRTPFSKVDSTPYLGSMYPQLGVMLEAFSSSKTILLSQPLVCHRTQTREEKIEALGGKELEAAFMSDEKIRNAQFFSFPFVRMISEFLKKGTFSVSDIARIRENTVINGLYLDFLMQSVLDGITLGKLLRIEEYDQAVSLFGNLPLNENQQETLGVIKNLKDTVYSCFSEKYQIMDKEPNELTISVVTPSFNQAEFLSGCLSSVKGQTYQPIEHLVYDPGSTDGSREIAKEFPHVTLFEEEDNGQSDAVNKGFVASKGDIVAWINSDDEYYDSNVFETIARIFKENPSVDIVYGEGEYWDQDGKYLRDAYINKDHTSLDYRFQHEVGVMQPATFIRKLAIEKIGILRADLHFCMDYEYWIRAVKLGCNFLHTNQKFAIARYHLENKTYGQRGESYSEVCGMMMSHFNYVNHIWLKRYAEYIVEGYDGVLKNTQNTLSEKEEEIIQEYKKLLVDYNCCAMTYELLTTRSSERGYGDTLRELQRLELRKLVPCEEVDLALEYKPYCVCYTVGKKRWAFLKKWKDEQIMRTHRLFDELRRERKSDICVIVGNGPSLKKIDLNLLRDVDVIISNNSFLSEELYSHAKYFTVVNYLVAEQSSYEINQLEGVLKILPYWLAYTINPSDDTYFVDAVGRPEFSKDIYHNMSWRHTVTFYNMHLAYGLGYKKVIMIGFDHSYKQPEGVDEQQIILSYENDENHFHPNYFKGKQWQAADVEMMEEMYKLAKVAYEEDGREIVNATVGGELELFRRESLEDFLIKK